MNKYILCAMLFLMSIVQASPTGWRDEIRIVPGNDEQPYGHCCITTDPSNRIHTAIRKMMSVEPRCYDIDYYRSLNTGVSWSQISLGASGGVSPVEFRSTDILASGDNLMIVFQRYNDVYFVKSTNGGDTWIPPVEIVSFGIHPRIAVNEGYLHSIYAADVVNNYEIFHKQSTNGGGNWSVAQPLTDAIRNSWHPAVSVNAGAIHVVWADNRISETNYEIYYDKSTDQGANWVYQATSGFRFTQVSRESEFPDIVAYTDPNYNAVHVVWMDARIDSPGIWHRRSTNNGADWQDPVLLFANGHHPSIVADSQGLYVVWEKDSYIYYRESTNWGTTWQTTLRITNTLDADSFPDITADDLGRHIVFVRRAVGLNESKIWYKQRDIVKPAAPQNLHKDPWFVPPPVIFYWNANSEADLKKYRIYRRMLPGSRWRQIGSTTETTFTDRIFPKLGCWYAYYVTAVDLANNESDPSNTIEVYVPDPRDRVNLGTPEPSPYTIERDGYYQWGASPDSTTDFGNCLKYCFSDLNPEYDYTFGFMLFEPAFDSGRVLAIKFKNQNIVEDIAVPESALCVCFTVPKPLYNNGELNIRFNVGAKEAVLSQILIWENIPGSGPQSMGSFGIEDGLDLKLYPIPAQDKVSISYDLPIRALVSIEIYDCLGRVVYKNKEMQECGLQRLEWNTNHMSAGVYYVVVKHSNIAVARKILILRK